MKSKRSMPRMFSDPKTYEPKTIEDMRNLGPVSAKDLKLAGITKPSQLFKLGAKKAFVKMIDARRKKGLSTRYYNALYLYALHGAIHNLDWRVIPEDLKREYMAFTAELRASGKYK